MTSLYLSTTTDLTENEITIMRRGVPQVGFQSIDKTPEGRAALLREVARDVKSGDDLVVGPGDWNFGLDPWILPPCTIAGAGQGQTRFINSQESQATSCGFEFFRGAKLTDMTLIWRPRDSQIRGGQTIGIARPSAPPMIIASLERCDVYSYGGSAMYFWGGGISHRIRTLNCRFFAGRWPVVIGDSRSANYVNLTIDQCTINGDFQVYGGAGGDMGVPPNTTGLLARGGTAVMNGGNINIIGTPGFELAIGAAVSSLGDHGYPNLPTAGMVGNLTLNNVTSRVQANGTTHAVDLWEQAGVLTVNGGSGSAADGSFVKQTGPF